jgi:hypothetical protein
MMNLLAEKLADKVAGLVMTKLQDSQNQIKEPVLLNGDSFAAEN